MLDGMNRRVPLDQLLQKITLQPAEAVAIVQQLIHGPAPETVTAPFGPPTPATVHVAADGSVSCSTCDTLVVSELASLLDAMLPESGTAAVGVPGGLRYIVARARLEVDAPPFDSVEEFARALGRHERGDRAAVIQRAIARANDSRLDRRRTDPAVAHLRRQLRDADVRVYDQQRAIDALSAMTAQAPAGNRRLAVAAGVFIGVLFAGGGLLMRAPAPVLPPLAARPAPDVPDVTRVAPVPALEPVPRAAAPATVAPAPVTKRTSRPAATTRDRAPAKSKRFQWLRTRWVFRTDPL